MHDDDDDVLEDSQRYETVLAVLESVVLNRQSDPGEDFWSVLEIEAMLVQIPSMLRQRREEGAGGLVEVALLVHRFEKAPRFLDSALPQAGDRLVIHGVLLIGVEF